MRRALVFCVGLMAMGCGRPATVQDCEQIVARITELELKKANITDPQQVQQEVEHSKAAFHDETMAQCVGRRVTQKFLQCIKNAQNANQLLEECLD